ncbi:hypothetical protein BC629DRAFT_1292002, partial [Irpex lacteus]
MDAFGGKHMVVCGDFGQLPPPGDSTKPLYASSISYTLGGDLRAQKNTMGKALWHLFTMVVLLRENMRQRGLSEEDKKFRIALENIRFASATKEDLALLWTRVAGPLPHQPKPSQPEFCDVSALTAKNAVRDAIVYVRSPVHAIQEENCLFDFVSRDRLPASRASASATEARRLALSTCDPVRTTNVLPAELRDMLWSLSPRRTEHVAGRLRLCVGMPVMLKANEATELCATNGAEGVVVGWDSEPHPDVPGVHYLNTLFVRLSNPATDVYLPDLPTNVVPITPGTVYFNVPIDKKTSLRICRSQVQVLPNFAMTDFACQGRTRPYNVVDLRDCRSHMSMYTMLSRGSSLSGTLILYPFD